MPLFLDKAWSYNGGNITRLIIHPFHTASIFVWCPDYKPPWTNLRLKSTRPFLDMSLAVTLIDFNSDCPVTPAKTWHLNCLGSSLQYWFEFCPEPTSKTSNQSSNRMTPSWPLRFSVNVFRITLVLHGLFLHGLFLHGLFLHGLFLHGLFQHGASANLLKIWCRLTFINKL